MAKPIENVAYLSQTVGPRPAGTEEEQQAALYITENLQQEAGFAAVIEDFNNSPDYDLPRAILVAVSLIVALLAMFVQVMVVPALLITLVCAVVLVAELLGKTKLSRLLGNGVSQNVVAKYVPASAEDAASPRRRKVVLVANYDSGKVQGAVSRFLGEKASILKWVAVGGAFAIPLIMLVRSFVAFGGVSLVVVNVLTVLAMLCAAVVLVEVVVNRAAAYNEAANCNAAGVAVLLEVARRVGGGSVAASPFAADEGRREPEVHGETAVREAGLIPEEAELVYEVSPIPVVEAPEFPNESPEARLMAAKAAVAALSGKPVSASINIAFEEDAERTRSADFEQDMAESDSAVGVEPVQLPIVPKDASLDAASDVQGVDEDGLSQPKSAASSEAFSAAAVSTSAVASQSGVPDWFRKAQEKAKRPAESADPAYRSRYADAIDAAERERSARKQEEDRVAVSETEARIQKMREDIMSGRASGLKTPMVDSSKSGKTDSEGVFASGVEVAGGALSGGALVSGAVAAVGAASGAASAAGVAGIAGTNAAAAATAGAAGVVLSASTAVAGAVVPTGTSDAGSAVGAGLAGADALGAEAVSSVFPRKQHANLSIPAVVDESPSSDVEPDGSDRKSPSMRKKRSIALPSVGKALSIDAEREVNTSDAEAEPVRSKTGVIRGLRSKLPSVGTSLANQPQQDLAPASEPVSDQAPDLRGFGLPEDIDGQAEASAAVAARNRFASLPEIRQSSASDALAADEADLGATRAFQPYGEVCEVEAEAQIPADDFTGHDEAPSSAELQRESTDVDLAAASPEPATSRSRSAKAARGGYSNVPKSRIQGFLSRFSRGDERRSVREEHSTPQEWLDIDQDFDARSVGAARGGWESFRQDEPVHDEYASRVPQRYSSEMDAAFSDEDENFGSKRRSRRWEGGSASREQLGRVSTLSGVDDGYVEAPSAARSAEESVYRFRHPNVDVEVWFVALGSELAANGGMEAFMAEHVADLKGAVFIELEGLGAGDLAVVEKEGVFKPCASASRMRRYASKASAELGAPLARAAIEWRETTSAYVMRRGYQALHVIGAKDGKPAFFGQADDVVDNVDEETILRNADFVMELLKQI